MCGLKMGGDVKKEGIEQLRKMIKQKPSDESVGKVFVNFCVRNGVSMETCKEYYRFLVEKGEIQEE